MMPIILVAEESTPLCLDITSGKRGIEMTNAGVCGIKGGWVHQMDIDALEV